MLTNVLNRLYATKHSYICFSTRLRSWDLELGQVLGGAFLTETIPCCGPWTALLCRLQSETCDVTFAPAPTLVGLPPNTL